eukprot:8885425-Karenia_brevis.AAC.1
MLSSPVEGAASSSNNSTGFAAPDATVQADHNDTLPNHMAMDAADLFIVDEDEGLEQHVTTTPDGGHGPPEDAEIEVRNGSLPPAWPAAYPYPVEDDRILVVKEPWVSMILSGEKTMELRHIKLNQPWYWLARSGSGLIVGRAETDGFVLMESVAQLQEYEEEHRFRSTKLPYKKTYGTRLRNVQAVPDTPYVLHVGAVGVVKYQAPEWARDDLQPDVDNDPESVPGVSRKFEEFVESVGDSDGLYALIRQHATSRCGSTWWREDLKTVLDEICMESGLLDHMESDLDLAQVSNYLEMLQAEAAAQEKLIEAIAGSPWTWNQHTSVHEADENNMNLDDWRNGKRKRTSSSFSQSETQDQTGTMVEMDSDVELFNELKEDVLNKEVAAQQDEERAAKKRRQKPHEA